jgi:hypothetical protein
MTAGKLPTIPTATVSTGSMWVIHTVEILSVVNVKKNNMTQNKKFLGSIIDIRNKEIRNLNQELLKVKTENEILTEKLASIRKLLDD